MRDFSVDLKKELFRQPPPAGHWNVPGLSEPGQMIRLGRPAHLKFRKHMMGTHAWDSPLIVDMSLVNLSRIDRIPPPGAPDNRPGFCPLQFPGLRELLLIVYAL